MQRDWCVAVCCIVLVCCGVLQCLAAFCSVLQCAAKQVTFHVESLVETCEFRET